MEPHQSRRNLQSTAIVAVALLLALSLALFVMFAIGWGLVAMLAVTAGFVLLGVLHYLVWGRRELRAVMARRGRPLERDRRTP